MTHPAPMPSVLRPFIFVAAFVPAHNSAAFAVPARNAVLTATSAASAALASLAPSSSVRASHTTWQSSGARLTHVPVHLDGRGQATRQLARLWRFVPRNDVLGMRGGHEEDLESFEQRRAVAEIEDLLRADDRRLDAAYRGDDAEPSRTLESSGDLDAQADAAFENNAELDREIQDDMRRALNGAHAIEQMSSEPANYMELYAGYMPELQEDGGGRVVGEKHALAQDEGTESENPSFREAAGGAAERQKVATSDWDGGGAEMLEMARLTAARARPSVPLDSRKGNPLLEDSSTLEASDTSGQGDETQREVLEGIARLDVGGARGGSADDARLEDVRDAELDGRVVELSSSGGASAEHDSEEPGSEEGAVSAARQLDEEDALFEMHVAAAQQDPDQAAARAEPDPSHAMHRQLSAGRGVGMQDRDFLAAMEDVVEWRRSMRDNHAASGRGGKSGVGGMRGGGEESVAVARLPSLTAPRQQHLQATSGVSGAVTRGNTGAEGTGAGGTGGEGGCAEVEGAVGLLEEVELELGAEDEPGGRRVLRYMQVNVRAVQATTAAGLPPLGVPPRAGGAPELLGSLTDSRKARALPERFAATDSRAARSSRPHWPLRLRGWAWGSLGSRQAWERRADDLTGLVGWRLSQHFARALFARGRTQGAFAGAHVLEIGCGTGLVGLAVAHAGVRRALCAAPFAAWSIAMPDSKALGAASVSLSDRSPYVLRLAEANAARTALAGDVARYRPWPHAPRLTLPTLRVQG